VCLPIRTRNSTPSSHSCVVSARCACAAASAASRAPKDVEERVALRIDFVAAVRGKGLANHTPIAFSARAGSTDEFDPRPESDPMTDPR
jgi:hypothetical protein